MLDKPRTGTPLFISIHDVSPAALPEVNRALAMIRHSAPSAHVDLLVIPGVGWKSTEIAELRRWSESGCSLLGHGWSHQAVDQKNTLHRIHSALLSRTAAEHLSRSRDQVGEIITRCFNWFADHDLPSPNMYVPPAWAMGTAARTELRQLPFRFYEFLTGIYDADKDEFYRSPLLGYEADTLLRTICLRAFNRANKIAARLFGGPLRMSIHPYDIDFRMQQDLRRDLATCLAADSRFHSSSAADWIARRGGTQ